MGIRLIHIAPELPPTVGGVADYTTILSRRLLEVSDGALEPVLVHAGKASTESIEGEFPTVDLSGKQSASALADTVRDLAEETDGRAIVLLEYSGYGYAKRGTPLWLARGLRQLNNRWTDLTLVTMCHELYATSRKPWESVFWLSPVQRYITSQIARLSDGILTNRRASARKLREMTDEETPIRVCFTFSNVGEPRVLSSYEEREPYAVIFGGAGRKAVTYEQHSAVLGRALRRMGVERIVDIGTTVGESAFTELGLPVKAVGVLSAAEVSAYLQRASVGVLQYPLHCLTKSGLWASYAAHGVPPVLIADRQLAEGLEEGRHYVLLSDLEDEVPSESQRRAISCTVKQWYDEEAHSQRAARIVLDLLPMVPLETAHF